MTWSELADFEADQRELENTYFVEVESEAEARDRMTEAEALADLQFALVAQWRQPHPGRAARAKRMKRRGGVRRAGQ